MDAFCDVLRDAAGAPDLESDEGLAAFRELAENAPDEISDDMGVVIGAIERLEELDENDPEAFEEFFAIALDPSFVAATENLESFAVDECGLPPDAFDDDEGVESLDDGESSGESADAALGGGVEIDGLQEYLEANAPGEAWVENIVGWSVIGSQVFVSGTDLEPDALEACAAILAYSVSVEPSVTVTVADLDGAELAVGTVEDGCAAP